MRRVLWLSGVVALTLLPAQPLQAAPAPHGYVGCGIGATRQAGFCLAGDHLTAFFKTPGRDHVSYRLCVSKPHQDRNCHRERTGRRGRSRVQVGGTSKGTLRVAWFVDRRRVDTDKVPIRPRKVFVNGDSLAEGTRPYLPRALPSWQVEQSVAVSRHAPEGVAILRRRKLPAVIVMSLGTNDDPRAVGAFRDAVTETLRLAGRSRCVVWPNIVRPPVGGASYAGYNAALASLDRRRRNLRVVDWAGLVRRHGGWLAADGVHVSAEGYKARARAIAKQVGRC